MVPVIARLLNMNLSSDATICKKARFAGGAARRSKHSHRDDAFTCTPWPMVGFDGMSADRVMSHEFDPISLLVEDAIASDPPELFYDFLDCLMPHQQPTGELPLHDWPTA